MPALILASTSRYRRALLERLRVPFATEAPGVDERECQAGGGEPAAIAAMLARRKALAVASRHPEAVVIGSDQVAAIDDRVLDKPGTAARAIEQLQMLRGREHRLVTAVAVARARDLAEFADVTRLQMRDLDDDALARYVAADQPLDCAGSYRIESLGITLFEAIDSRDHTAIVGLPLLQLAGVLRSFGFALP